MKSQTAATALVAIICLNFQINLVQTATHGASCASEVCDDTTTTFLECVGPVGGARICQCANPTNTVWEGTKCGLKSGIACVVPQPSTSAACVTSSSCIDVEGTQTCRCNYGLLPGTDGRCTVPVTEANLGGACTLYPRGANADRVCLKTNAHCTGTPATCSCIEGWKQLGTGASATCSAIDFPDAEIDGPCTVERTDPVTHFECVDPQATCVGTNPAARICTCNTNWQANEDNTACVPIHATALINAACNMNPTLPEHPVCAIDKSSCVDSLCRCETKYAPNAARTACNPVGTEVNVGQACQLAATVPDEPVCNKNNAACVSQVCTCNDGYGPNPTRSACIATVDLGAACKAPAVSDGLCAVTNATCTDGKCTCNTGLTQLFAGDDGLNICYKGSGMVLIPMALAILAQQAFLFIQNKL